MQKLKFYWKFKTETYLKENEHIIGLYIIVHVSVNNLHAARKKNSHDRLHMTHANYFNRACLACKFQLKENAFEASFSRRSHRPRSTIARY